MLFYYIYIYYYLYLYNNIMFGLKSYTLHVYFSIRFNVGTFGVSILYFDQIMVSSKSLTSGVEPHNT